MADPYDPQPGEVYDVPGWNSKIKITGRGERLGWGPSVWIQIIPNDWAYIRNPNRILSMRRWPEMISFLGMKQCAEETRDG